MGKGGGGGGQSGRIEYPPYMTNLHSFLIYGTDLAGRGNLPFGTAAYSVDNGEATPYSTFDFDSLFVKLSKAQSGVFDTATPISKIIVDTELSPASPADTLPVPSSSEYLPAQTRTAAAELDNFVDAVDDLQTTTDLGDKQDAFEVDSEDAHLRAINRFSSQMADINAVNSSAFIIGLALMESARQRQLTQFRAEMNYRDRYARIEGFKTAAVLTADYVKARLVADLDYIDQRVQYAMKNQLWSLELYKYASNALAGISGAVSSSEDKPSKISSALGGAMIGAGAGALIGGQIGGEAAWSLGSAAAGAGVGFIGLGIGALAGVAFGLLS